MAKPKKKAATKRRNQHPGYSDKFRAQALEKWRALKAEGKTAKEVAKALGVHPSMLYYWKAQAEGRPWGKTKPPGTNETNGTHARTPTAALSAEVRDLKAEVVLWRRVALAALEGRL